MRGLLGASRRGDWLIGTAILAALGAGALALSSSQSVPPDPSPLSLKSASSAHSSLPLVIDPDPVELGVLKPGQPAQTKFAACNWGSQPAMVERVETTCPCIQVTPGLFPLGAGESRDPTVRFDPTHNPEFRGRLSVVVTGFDGSERVLFRTRISFEVRGADQGPRLRVSRAGSARRRLTTSRHQGINWSSGPCGSGSLFFRKPLTLRSRMAENSAPFVILSDSPESARLESLPGMEQPRISQSRKGKDLRC